MKKALLFTALLLPFSSHHCLAESSGSRSLKNISDALTIFTPGGAVVSSFILEKPVQTGGYILELAGQELFVEGAKALFSNTSLGERPSDEDDDTHNGFISSHVSATTSGAIKLWEIYPDNSWVKVFAVAAVTLVGFQRVEGEHHTPLQVGLGIGTAFLFDYLGEKLTAYFGDGTDEPPTEQSTVQFSLNLPEKGEGLMTSLTWSF